MPLSAGASMRALFLLAVICRVSILEDAEFPSFQRPQSQ